MSLSASPVSVSTSPGRRLRVGIVGGVERTAVQLERAAESLGCSLEYHGGHTKGRGASALDALIRRVDVVVILTDVNSHNAVTQARRAALSAKRPHVLLRRMSPGRLGALVSVMLAQGQVSADALLSAEVS